VIRPNPDLREADTQVDTLLGVFMMQSDESLRETRLQKSPIFNAKSSTKIGT